MSPSIKAANCIRIFEYCKISIADICIDPNLGFEDPNLFGSPYHEFQILWIQDSRIFRIRDMWIIKLKSIKFNSSRTKSTYFWNQFQILFFSSKRCQTFFGATISKSWNSTFQIPLLKLNSRFTFKSYGVTLEKNSIFCIFFLKTTHFKIEIVVAGYFKRNTMWHAYHKKNENINLFAEFWNST